MHLERAISNLPYEIRAQMSANAVASRTTSLHDERNDIPDDAARLIWVRRGIAWS